MLMKICGYIDFGQERLVQVPVCWHSRRRKELNSGQHYYAIMFYIYTALKYISSGVHRIRTPYRIGMVNFTNYYLILWP